MVGHVVSKVILFKDMARNVLVVRMSDGKNWREFTIPEQSLYGNGEVLLHAPFFDGVPNSLTPMELEEQERMKDIRESKYGSRPIFSLPPPEGYGSW